MSKGAERTRVGIKQGGELSAPMSLSAVKILLQQIQAEIRQDDRLLARIKTELQDMDEITKWLEVERAMNTMG